MRIFIGWRAVGAAMLEARRRQGVRPVVTSGGLADTTESRWYLGGVMVSANRLTEWPERVDVEIRVGDTVQQVTHVTMWPAPNADTVLRVLAALKLIPAEIAYADDERYGRCKHCKGVVRRVANEGWPVRWNHSWLGGWEKPAVLDHIGEVDDA